VSAVAQNQITITADDLRARLAVGNTNLINTDTAMGSVNIGSHGLTLWDFSGLLPHTTTTLKSITLASAPFSSEFAGATHVLKTSLAGSFTGVPGTVAGDLYVYFTVGANFLNPGEKGSGTITLPGFLPVPGDLKISNAPPDTSYGLPATLGTKWGSTYMQTTVINAAGFPLRNDSLKHILSYVVDAYGPMKMPGGGIYDAIRVRSVDNTSGTKVGYIFLAKNGASVTLSATDAALPDSGTITVRKSTTWSPPFTIPTGVAITGTVPEGFALQQNYPNPFNPSTTIRYGLPYRSTVTLTVYNTLGQKVRTLVQGTLEAGNYEVTFDGTGLASGVYYYRIQAGSFVETKKLLLLG
jgi:hypothetical protein